MLNICVGTILFVSVVVIKDKVNARPDFTELHCNDLCSDVDSYMPVISGKWPTCERGCRFFNIIYLTDGHNITETKKGCHASCKEAYNLEEFKDCTAGCDATLNHIIQYTEKTNSAIIMADLEIIQSDMFLDSQIPMHNFRYKFADGEIRRIPFDALLNEEYLQEEAESGGHISWINCITKQAKISKLIIFHVFILLVVIVFLWAVNALNGPNLQDGKPLYEQDTYFNPDLDATDLEKPLNEKEEVKIVRFLEDEMLEESKNPKA